MALSKAHKKLLEEFKARENREAAGEMAIELAEMIMSFPHESIGGYLTITETAKVVRASQAVLDKLEGK